MPLCTLIGSPNNISSRLNAAANIKQHRRADAFMPHELHQYGRHHPKSPPIAEGSTEIVSRSVLIFPRRGFDMDHDPGLYADRRNDLGNIIDRQSLSAFPFRLGIENGIDFTVPSAVGRIRQGRRNVWLQMGFG